MHAAEFRAPRLPQIEIGEEAPEADGDVPHQRLLDLAEPAHETRQQLARNAVGQQEIDVFLRNDLKERVFHCHGTVKSVSYIPTR